MITRKMEAAVLRDAAKIVEQYRNLAIMMENQQGADRMNEAMKTLEMIAVQVSCID